MSGNKLCKLLHFLGGEGAKKTEELLNRMRAGFCSKKVKTS